jgi:hypothetical protein
MVDLMMYVFSLALIRTLKTQRERERGKSIEPDDDATSAADDDLTLSLDENPARSRGGYAGDTKQPIADTRGIPTLHTLGLLRHPLTLNPTSRN